MNIQFSIGEIQDGESMPIVQGVYYAHLEETFYLVLNSTRTEKITLQAAEDMGMTWVAEPKPSKVGSKTDNSSAFTNDYLIKVIELCSDHNLKHSAEKLLLKRVNAELA
jgi:hypothetical protein